MPGDTRITAPGTAQQGKLAPVQSGLGGRGECRVVICRPWREVFWPSEMVGDTLPGINPR